MKNITTVLFILSSLFTHTVSAQWSTDPFVLDKLNIKYVYDGDTFMLFCMDEHPCVDNKLSVRIKNIDTAEIKGKCAYEKELAATSRDKAIELIVKGEEIVITPNKDRPYDRNKRLLATVSIDGVDMGESLVSSGLARFWTGRRQPWCDL